VRRRIGWAAAATLALVLVLVLAGSRRERRPPARERAAMAPPPAIATERSTAPRPLARVPRFRTQVKVLSPHSRALRAKNEARASGNSVPATAALFDAEPRDAVWAPAMERALADRFRRGQEILAMAAMTGVEIKHSCRTSTCRIEVEYAAHERNPYGYLLGETGPFSQSSSDETPEPISVVDGVTKYRKVIHLAFGDEDSNPGRYESWYTEVKRRWDQARNRPGADLRLRRGLPPPEERQVP
jgi:hypothetical protein